LIYTITKTELITDNVQEYYKIIWALRNRFAHTITTSEVLFKKEWEKCKNDVVHFINTWCWIYEPRMSSSRNSDGKPTPSRLPFIMYEGQQSVVEEIEFCYNKGIDFIIAKSREAGISWAVVGWILHKWIFTNGFRAGIGSEKQDMVDVKGIIDPLMGKFRYILYNLPDEFRPKDYRKNKLKGTSGEKNHHDNLLRLKNPENQSEFVGQTGESIGEGGRFSIFVIDEEQNLSNPANADRALESTTNCRGGIGTSRGMNHFGQAWHSNARHRISVMWHQDPRKVGELATRKRDDGTYDKKIPYKSYWRKYTEERNRDKPEVIAQAYDMDWQASVSDLCIEPRWIQAAVDFQIPDGGNDDNIGGFDIAGSGSDSAVYIQRIGNVIQVPKQINFGEVTQNIWQAHQYAKDDKVHALQYDKQTIGESVYGLIMNSGEEIPYQLIPIAGNNSASSRVVADEGEVANRIYRNIRSEIWHTMRRLFRNTYEHTENIRHYDPEDLISIPNHAKLIEQLAYPKRFSKGGRWQIESKDNMRSRGLKSPDFADACAYAIADMELTKRSVLRSFTRSSTNGQYVKINVRPNQRHWEYIGAFYHNEFNDVSAVMARWNTRTHKLEIIEEYQGDSPQPKIIKRHFTKLLSQIAIDNIKWITQKKLFDDLISGGDYRMFQIYNDAKMKLTYNFAEDARAALLLTNEMFDKGIISISTNCRELVSQIMGLEMKPNKIDTNYGLPNALLLIIQFIKEKNKGALNKALNTKKPTPKSQGYSAPAQLIEQSLELSMGGTSVLS